MTGYASATRETAAGSLTLEFKSVNHRYLEFVCKLPEDLRALEPQLREAVAARLARGKVEGRIGISQAADGARSAMPDAGAMQALREAEAAVASGFPGARALSVYEILHWPGVLAISQVSVEALRDDVLAAAEAALKELDQTRAREGAKLAQVLRDRLASMKLLVAEAQPLIPGAVRAFQEKLAAKIKEAGGNVGDERLHQEVVLYASRIDIDEELERLGAHIAEFSRVLDKGGSCGKRLDFLCQELNREANTVGSKSVSGDLSRISMDLKVLIEQMREQVQNIE
jgi:uncharacterized protein (TIGR00255 family)